MSATLRLERDTMRFGEHRYRVYDGNRYLGDVGYLYWLRTVGFDPAFGSPVDDFTFDDRAAAYRSARRLGLTAGQAAELIRHARRLTTEHAIRSTLRAHGSCGFLYCELTETERATFPAPRYQVGEVVTVLKPWWRPSQERLKCAVTSADGYYADGKGYSLTVREAAHPGAHGRSIYESAVEGFDERAYSAYD